MHRHIRQYASLHALNSNDEESFNITSYSTRVERLKRNSGRNVSHWTLTLRKLEQIPYSNGQIRAEWWTEDFDAVIVATAENDSPYVPKHFGGLREWAKAFPDKVYHSREFRRAEDLEGKVSVSNWLK